MVSPNGPKASRVEHCTGGATVDLLKCRGTLILHKDGSHSCSETTCVKSVSSEQALGAHSSILLFHQGTCVRCSTGSGTSAGRTSHHVSAWLN